MTNIYKKFDVSTEEHECYGIISMFHNINTDYYKLLLKIIKLVRFKYYDIKIKNSRLVSELLYSEMIHVNLSNKKDIRLNLAINLCDYNYKYYHGESLNILLMYLFPYITQLYTHLNMSINSALYYKSISNINELEYQKFESNKKKSIDSVTSLVINLICNKELFNLIKENEKY